MTDTPPADARCGNHRRNAAPPGPGDASSSSTGDLDDLTILRQIGGGDLGSFDVFVNRYKDRLIRYAELRVGDRHAAEDLAQEVFLKVFRAARRGGLDDSRPALGPWMFAIARNCVRDHQRRRRRKPLILAGDMAQGPEERAGDGPDPAAAAAKADLLQYVRQMLQLLPDPQREVIHLKTIGQLTLAQIAQVMDCPLATAKSRLRCGLARVNQMLDAEGRCP